MESDQAVLHSNYMRMAWILAKTATADASSNWKYKFEDLDKYKAGNVVTYTVKEASVNEYNGRSGWVQLYQQAHAIHKIS